MEATEALYETTEPSSRHLAEVAGWANFAGYLAGLGDTFHLAHGREDVRHVALYLRSSGDLTEDDRARSALNAASEIARAALAIVGENDGQDHAEMALGLALETLRDDRTLEESLIGFASGRARFERPGRIRALTQVNLPDWRLVGRLGSIGYPWVRARAESFLDTRGVPGLPTRDTWDASRPGFGAPPVDAGPLGRVRDGDEPPTTTLMPTPGHGPGFAKPIRRLVSTGFAARKTPNDPLPVDQTLAGGRRYWFWLEVGKPQPGSIEANLFELPRTLAEGTRLIVSVHDFPDGLVLDDAADVGELQIAGEGARVITQPGRDHPDHRTRLFFPVRTRFRSGLQRLRCNIYANGVLLQSREVRAQVRLLRAGEAARALESTVDYTISKTFAPELIASIPAHRLSLMLNGDGDTHQLRYLGTNNIRCDVHLDSLALATAIDDVRGALRRASWGSSAEWDGNAEYQYANPTSERLRTDLVTLACAGFRLFANVLKPGLPDQLRSGTTALQRQMRTPGLVQIASRADLRTSVPAAMIYDHPIDGGLATYTLCPEFAAALANQTIPTSKCLAGACPSHGQLSVVCPSGFWGFRHAIGIPLSLAEQQDDVATSLGCVASPLVTVAVCTDPKLSLRAAHVQALQQILGGPPAVYAKTRSEAEDALRRTDEHVYYFYCHGGAAERRPFLLLGPPDPMGITPDNLEAWDVRWAAPRPLVFINGCHTTALSPWEAYNFVTAFATNANAAGVIGTDITVFEPLASAFAEAFFRAFVIDNQCIGEAIRRARLALLAKQNPLGLVYLPFALANLRLRAGAAA